MDAGGHAEGCLLRAVHCFIADDDNSCCHCRPRLRPACSLVINVAKRYANNGIDLGDLIPGARPALWKPVGRQQARPLRVLALPACLLACLPVHGLVDRLTLP